MADRSWVNNHPRIVAVAAVAAIGVCVASFVRPVLRERKREQAYRRYRQEVYLERRRRASRNVIGKLIFEGAPLMVRDPSGKTYPLEKRGPTINCGGVVDVMWSPKAVLFMKEKGVFEQVLTATGDTIYSDLEWDGLNVWVSIPRKGIWILDTAGVVVAKVDKDDGLPPGDKGLLLHIIEPGRMFAVGSFEPHGRGWCAIVEYKERKVSVNVFHAARKVRTKPYGKDEVDRDPYTVFVPYRLRERITQGRRKIFVARCEKKYRWHPMIYPLEIDVSDLSVRISSNEMPRPGLRPPDLVYNGKIYVPGKVWYRIDPEKRGRETLMSEGTLAEPYRSLRDYWVSAHYGLAGWLGDRQLFQIRITDEEHDILAKFQPGPGEYYHTFGFEDEDGAVRDYEELEWTTFAICRPGKPTLHYAYKDYRQGGFFPVGTYHAWRGETHVGTDKGVKSCKFEPITVTEDSPVHLVFRVRPAEEILYRGRVVHALSGQPMSGAFVTTGFSGNLAWVSPEQWDALHRLPDHPPLDDEALWAVKNTSWFGRIVRTDANGCFEMKFISNKSPYSFVAFEQDFMSTTFPSYRFDAPRGGIVELKPIPLFPAAKIVVEPSADYLNVWLRFVRDENEDSPTANTFFSMYGGYSSGPEVAGVRLEENLKQPYHVPAGFSFRMKFSVPYDDRWCIPEIPRTVCLNQGETLDLGRFVFDPAMTIFIRAVDSAGNPLRGVLLTKSYEDPYHHIEVHKTDENGLTSFYVEPNSIATFRVRSDERRRRVVQEFSYEVRGRAEAEKEFILQVSDEILRQIFE